MSFRDCIDRAIAGGEMDEARGRAAQAEFDEIYRDYQTRMGANAEAAAAHETVRRQRVRAAEKKRQTLLALKAAQRINHRLNSYKDMKGVNRPERAALAIMDKDPWLRAGGESSVETRRRSISGTLHAMMDQSLSDFRTRMLGLSQDRAGIRDIVREAFGVDTGNAAAKQAAKAFNEAAEYIRKRFNEAGGHIAKRNNWRLPNPNHDALALSKVSREDWIDFIMPRLDRADMIDEVTGEPFSDMRLRDLLAQTYDRIRTDGMVDLQPGRSGGSMLANRHADSRFLVFKDADSWMEYNKRFGSADPWSAMIAHLEVMAKDTALLEVLGPNPDHMMRYIADRVRKDGVMRGTPDRSAFAARTFENMYKDYTGKLQTPVHARFSRILGSTRAALVAAQLGGAFISALSDTAFVGATSRMNALSATRVMGNYFKLMNPANEADRQLAVRLGLIADSWIQKASAQMRFTGEVAGGMIAKQLSDTVMRASLLTPHTQSMRWAFGMEFMGALADQAGRRFDELPKAMRRSMENYGFNAGSWDTLRNTPIFEDSGARFLRPDDVFARSDIAPDRARELGQRLYEMILNETEYAVPNASLRSRALLQQGTQAGTIIGELARSAAMYKSFPITVIYTHMMRAITQDGWPSKARYAAGLAISVTLMGAFAYQMKQIARGLDPITMDPQTEEGRSFWRAALLQGGGAGIFGDFLFADQTRYGHSFAETLAGPVVGLGADAVGLVIGSAQQEAIEGESNFGRDAVRFVQRYTPGSSLWYGRLAFERYIWDELHRWADPNANRVIRNRERRLMRDTGQQYWWRPGEKAPDRAPQFGRAIGD